MTREKVPSTYLSQVESQIEDQGHQQLNLVILDFCRYKAGGLFSILRHLQFDLLSLLHAHCIYRHGEVTFPT